MVIAREQASTGEIAVLQRKLSDLTEREKRLAAQLAELRLKVLHPDADPKQIADEKQRVIHRLYEGGLFGEREQMPTTDEIAGDLNRLKNIEIPSPYERQPQPSDATAVAVQPGDPNTRPTITAVDESAPTGKTGLEPQQGVTDTRVPLTLGQRTEVALQGVKQFIDNAGENVYNMVAAIPMVLKQWHEGLAPNPEEIEASTLEWAKQNLGVSEDEYQLIKQSDPDIDKKLAAIKMYDKVHQTVFNEPVVQLAKGQVDILKRMATEPLQAFYEQPVDVALTLLAGYGSVKGLNAPPRAAGAKPAVKPTDAHGYFGVTETVPKDLLLEKAAESYDNINQMGVGNTMYGINKQIEVLEEAVKTKPELIVELDALKHVRDRLNQSLKEPTVEKAAALPDESAAATAKVEAEEPEAPVDIEATPEIQRSAPARDQGNWESIRASIDDQTPIDYEIEQPGNITTIKSRATGQYVEKASYNPKTGEFIVTPPGQLHAMSLRGKKFDDFVRLVFDRNNNTVGSRAWQDDYSTGADFDPVKSFEAQFKAYERLSKNSPGLRWVIDADEFIPRKGAEVFDATRVPAERIMVTESKPSQFVVGVTAHKEGLQLPGSAIAAFDKPHMVEFFTNQVFDEMLPGAEVVARRPQLGVWGKYEPSFALIVNDSIEAVRAYAAKLGKAADNQDAVVIADASRGGKDMFEFQLPKRLTPALLERINAARENAGIVAGSIDLSSGKLRIYDIFGDVKGKINQFADDLDLDYEVHDTYSELIENSQYDQYIRDWESISARRKAESGARAGASQVRPPLQEGVYPRRDSKNAPERDRGRLREEAKVLTPDAAAKLGRKLEQQSSVVDPNEPRGYAAPDAERSPATPEVEPSGYPSTQLKTPEEVVAAVKAERDSAAGSKLTASNVRSAIKRIFGLPNRLGNMRSRRAAGEYHPYAEEVRLEQGWGRNLGVISHELGHHLEGLIFGVAQKLSRGSAHLRPFQKELHALGKALYGNTRPNGGYLREGLAEYIRKYIDENNAAQAAPQFHDFFTNTVLTRDPVLKAAMDEIISLVNDIKKQSAVEMLEGMIDWGTGKKLTDLDGDALKLLYHKAITKFWDSNNIFDVVEKELGKLGKEYNPNKLRASEIARYIEKSAQGKAYAAVFDGVYDFAGNKKYPGLKEIFERYNFKGLKDPEFREAIVYAVAKHVEDLRARGKNQGIAPGITQPIIAQYGSKWDRFATDLTGWFNGLLSYLAEPGVGMLSPEAYAATIAQNPFYVPLMKIFDESGGRPSGGSGGGRIANLGNPVKRIGSSDRDIRNVVGQAFEKAFTFISAADKARVFNAIVKEARAVPGYAKLITEIPAKQVASKFGLGKVAGGLRSEARRLGVFELDEIGKFLEELDENLKGEDIDAMVTLYANAKNYFGNEPILFGRVNGEIKFYYVDPHLYEAFAGMDNVFLPKFIDTVLGAPARAERLGRTGANISFGLFNTIRDAATFMIQGDVASYKNPLADILLGAPQRAGKLGKAMIEEFRDYFHEQWGIGKVDDIGRRMRVSAVELSQMLGTDMHNLRHMRATVDKLFANDAKAKAANLVKHPLEALREIVSVTEMAPRRAAYKEVLQKMGELEAAKNGRPVSIEAAVRAANAANEVTLNFKRMGMYTRIVNQITPFFNATIQGPARMKRELMHNPKRAIPRAIAGITIPTMVLWEMNRDEEWWQELPEWRKWLFWNFRVNDRTVSIPMPFEWGVLFGAIPMALADARYRRKPDEFINKDIAIEGTGAGLETFLPSMLPTTLRIPTEVMLTGEQGYDIFKDKPIVPFYTVQTTEDPRDRYTAWTPKTYRKLAEALGYTGIRVSPLKIQHVAEGFTGGLAGNVIETIESLGKPSQVEEPADLPIVGRFFTRDKDSRQKEYEQKQERVKMRNKIKNMLIRDPESERAFRLLERWNEEHPETPIYFKAGELYFPEEKETDEDE